MKPINLFGMLAALFIIQFSANAQVNYVKRINCGGTVTASYNSNSFEPEASATGVTYNGELTNNTLTHAGLSEPMKSIRFTKNASMTYDFTVTNGSYRVLLHFAEVYHGVAPGTDPNTRQFDVDVENGQYTATDLNVFSAAGGSAGDIYTIDTTVSVTDGNVTITLSKGSGNDPLINAIEVLGVDGVNPTAPTLSSSGQTSTTADLSWSGATDNVGVTGYKIYKDGSLETTLGSVLSATVSNLTSATQYAFTVTALDAAGNESAVSNTVNVTTDSGGGSSSSGWNAATSLLHTSDKVAVGISSVPTDYQMAINGKIIAEELTVQLQGSWPDYVFLNDYDLPTLTEVATHIREKGHLINVPSAKELESTGVSLGEMDKILLEKIEELTLYLLQLNEENQELKKQVSELQSKLK